MSVYKRPDSKYWWFKLTLGGKLYQRPTKLSNKREAEDYERAFRTKLINGEVGLDGPKTSPTLREFEQRFVEFIETDRAGKPETVRFYKNRFKRLLEWSPLGDARLGNIDSDLVDRYKVFRRKSVGVVSTNRELATLRRALHLAREWKLIKGVPKVRLLADEPQRDYVLDRDLEPKYLAACQPLLHDVAVLLIDTGLRVGEAVALQWSDIHFDPAGKARYGWLNVRSGKTKYAKRNVPLTARVSSLLKSRMEAAQEKNIESQWVFYGDSPENHILTTSLAHMHAEVCRPGRGEKRRFLFSKDFVVHSLRHTALTRFGEAGADAFTIQKLAGHSSVTISQRYMHPTSEIVENVFDHLAALNKRASRRSKKKKVAMFSGTANQARRLTA
jgi:integrase